MDRMYNISKWPPRAAEHGPYVGTLIIKETRAVEWWGADMIGPVPTTREGATNLLRWARRAGLSVTRQG